MNTYMGDMMIRRRRRWEHIVEMKMAYNILAEKLEVET
jgi:hypothetical protein